MSIKIGEKYNRLKAVREIETSKSGRWYEFLCDCGAYTEARGAAVKWGAPKSCGCLKEEEARKAAVKRRKRITKTCPGCGSKYQVPECRHWRDHYCSAECRIHDKEKKLEARKIPCEICDTEFIPRDWQVRNNIGRYCSQECSHKADKGRKRSDESKIRMSIAQRLSVREGRKRILRGPDNPLWMGGYKAHRERMRESGKERERTREYRKNNPEKAREFAHNRKSKKYGRLPKGTVSKIKEWQRHKCAICCVKLPVSYHVDHITPLARGGKHEKNNIQLLCPTCNVRKSAKDPIDYMQEQGMLL